MKQLFLALFMFAFVLGVQADDTKKKEVTEKSDKFCVVPEDGNNNQTSFVFTKADDTKKKESDKKETTTKNKKDDESCSTDKESKDKSCCSSDKSKTKTKTEKDPKK